MEEELICLVALARGFVYNCTAARELFERYGSAKGAYDSVKEKLGKESLDAAGETIDLAHKHGFEIVTIGDSRYPIRLKECSDAPLILYKKGNCNLNSSRAISIVGTRSSTEYGKKYCEQIVKHLALCRPGPLIISGMATGIDSCAHRAALENGLNTVAVMGTGFDIVYPPCNQNLSERICEAGCLLTEFGSGTPSYPYNFARRNRIIAGMSDAVVLCESKARGGGMITAHLAFDYSRSVFAVPGRMDDISFNGCNLLIEKQVATIVSCCEVITDTLKWEPAAPADLFSEVSPEKGLILDCLRQKGEQNLAEIADAVRLPMGEVARLLIEMEIDGQVMHLHSNKYSI
ncbi:MAG: DNA-processing protein DprA [Bacteroidales bacterium]|nr:DNA-processing protein DprA [Bacteroidales bacterium]